MNIVVASDKLKRTEVWAEDDESVRWAGAFAVYGGHGTTASSTIVYEIEPGKRLGWHTDATEETQYIIAGTGELHMEDGTTHRVGPGSVFAIPTRPRATSSALPIGRVSPRQAQVADIKLSILKSGNRRESSNAGPEGYLTVLNNWLANLV